MKPPLKKSSFILWSLAYVSYFCLSLKNQHDFFLLLPLLLMPSCRWKEGKASGVLNTSSRLVCPFYIESYPKGPQSHTQCYQNNNKTAANMTHSATRFLCVYGTFEEKYARPAQNKQGYVTTHTPSSFLSCFTTELKKPCRSWSSYDMIDRTQSSS